MAASGPVAVAYLALQAPRPGTAAYTHVHEIVRGLRCEGFSVDLYAPGYAGGGDKPGIAGRALAYAGTQLRLLARWRRYRVLYVRGHFAAWPATLAARLTGKLVVLEVNGPFADAFINNPGLRPVARLLSASEAWQHRHASGLICVTSGLAAWLGERAPEIEVEVIPNGANVTLFDPLREPWPGLERPYAVFFGGLSAWHGVDWLLSAVRSPEWPTGVDLVVVGEGPGSADVARAAAAGAPVRVLGRLAYEDVGRVVAHARASLVTIVDARGRAATGLAPIKLFESVACGVPVIVSDLEGQAELVRELELGCVVPVGDTPALARAVAALCTGEGPGAGFRARVRRVAEQQFSWAARSRHTAAFLRRLLAHAT